MLARIISVGSTRTFHHPFYRSFHQSSLTSFAPISTHTPDTLKHPEQSKQSKQFKQFKQSKQSKQSKQIIEHVDHKEAPIPIFYQVTHGIKTLLDLVKKGIKVWLLYIILICIALPGWRLYFQANKMIADIQETIEENNINIQDDINGNKIISIEKKK